MIRKITFHSDGVVLRGLLHIPDNGSGPFPTIVMAHGFCMVKEMGMDWYAEAFAKAGIAVLLYDNRNLGESGGEVRQDIDPVAQIRDYRVAISFAEQQDVVDRKRIGIWGTSYTGGAVCAVAALDRRVKCLVSQVPYMSGLASLQENMNTEQRDGFEAMLEEDRASRSRGEPPGYVKLLDDGSGEPAMFSNQESDDYVAYFVDRDPDLRFENRITIRSLEYMAQYDVAGYMPHIGLKPLLMILAQDDPGLTAPALSNYAAIKGPKEMMVVNSHHYSPYIEHFEEACSAARDWFLRHL